MRIVRFFLLILWLLFWTLLVSIVYLLKKKNLRATMLRIACKGLLRICGVRVKMVGEPAGTRPLLMVSNHISYLDIWILSSLVDCRFVAKKEISKWPGVNIICKIQDVVFIDRSTSKISDGSDAIRTTLAAGEIVSLFPEATTGDGRHLLPFKPAFFEAAQGAMVQPVAIAYRRINGLPIDYSQWPNLAWYGDMMLLPHLLHLFTLGRIDVEVHFLSPLSTIGENRKTLAVQAHDAIEAALQQN